MRDTPSLIGKNFKPADVDIVFAKTKPMHDRFFFFLLAILIWAGLKLLLGVMWFQRLENELLYGRTERYRFEKVPTTR